MERVVAKTGRARGAGLLRSLALAAGLLLAAAPAAAATRYVNVSDATCQNKTPCYSTIQAAIAAVQPGDIVRVQPGMYPEKIMILDLYSQAGASEASRIVLEADPAAPVGSVVLNSPGSTCSSPESIRIARSRYVSVRGLSITGPGSQALVLAGAADDTQFIELV